MLLRPWLGRSGAAVAAAVLALPGALLAQPLQDLGRSGDWAIYAHDQGGKRLCFALAQPSTSEPRSARAELAYLYISSWPREGVRNEVSVKVGSQLKRGAPVIATLKGGSLAGTSDVTTFRLFTKDDRAFIDDATSELKMIEGMKKGATLTVQGVTDAGVQFADTFSLKGVTKALETLATSCR